MRIKLSSKHVSYYLLELYLASFYISMLLVCRSSHFYVAHISSRHTKAESKVENWDSELLFFPASSTETSANNKIVKMSNTQYFIQSVAQTLQHHHNCTHTDVYFSSRHQDLSKDLPTLTSS